MVDYSKWSRMEISDSESEHDDSDCDFDPQDEHQTSMLHQLQNEHARTNKRSGEDSALRPKVTRFDAEQRVTFGEGQPVRVEPGGRYVPPADFSTSSPSSGAKMPHRTTTACRTNSTEASAATALSCGTTSTSDKYEARSNVVSDEQKAVLALASSGSGAAATSTAQHPARTAYDWNQALASDWTRNGGYCADSNPPYYWSQNQREVFVRFQCSSSCVVHEKLRPQFEKFGPRQVQIRPLMLEPFQWTYEVDAAATTEEEDIDWEFENGTGRPNQGMLNVRYLKLTVVKKSMITGTVLWWRAAFKGHPEMQPEQIQDRSKRNIERQKEFYNRMLEATELFKQKVRKDNGAAILPVEEKGLLGVAQQSVDGEAVMCPPATVSAPTEGAGPH
ncbi:unnamed protein product [Amoebophrya sp. A120]|nr:unnamed protein product [Amoebophrya sp. A120]|eukprot:GSA120T00015138001.1